MEENQSIILGSKSEEVVQCSKCGKEITIEDRQSFLDNEGNEVYFCNDCIEEVNKHFEEETKNPNIVGAFALGIVAAAIGGLLWFLITVLTKVSFGYAALGLGWLVAMGTIYGAGKKRGMKIQLISAVITTITLLISELFIFLHLLGQLEDVNASAPMLFLSLIFSDSRGEILNLFIQNSISPIGLVIWAIAIYVAYIVPKAEKL